MYLCFLKYTTAFGSNPDPFYKAGNSQIIQWPAAMMNWDVSNNLVPLSTFHAFILPNGDPTQYTANLSSFVIPRCADLTNLNGDDIKDAPKFTTVAPEFESWVSTCCLGSTPTFVTSGDIELGLVAYRNYVINRMPYPSTLYNNYIDLKYEFSKLTNAARDVPGMMAYFNLEHQGAQYNGQSIVNSMPQVMSSLIGLGMEKETVEIESTFIYTYTPPVDTA
jgi:inhibitor of KinA sporulation pathway (predicted exonuclease)